MESEEVQIRSILNKWYEGTSSEDEDKRLNSYFAATDREKLPKDLLCAYTVFRGSKALAEEKFATKVIRHCPIYKWGLAAACAATVILIVCAGNMYSSFGNDYDGKRITKSSAITASTEYLSYLDILDDEFNLLNNIND